MTRAHDPLLEIDHRPWPLPPGPWVMRQTWHDLLFAHWPVEREPLKRHLPRGLELDEFEGRAYLGVVPFRMSDVALRGLPALPGTGAFPELNVRTYVHCGGMRGVWFFSLDAASALAVVVARRWFDLPYFRARMSCRPVGEGIAYASERTHRGAPPASLACSYAPAGPVARFRPGSLDEFLTERYCLYALDPSGAIWRGDIHHAPWPLQGATAHFEANTMARQLGIEIAGEPVLHFARRLDVRIWGPRRT